MQNAPIVVVNKEDTHESHAETSNDSVFSHNEDPNLGSTAIKEVSKEHIFVVNKEDTHESRAEMSHDSVFSHHEDPNFGNTAIKGVSKKHIAGAKLLSPVQSEAKHSSRTKRRKKRCWFVGRCRNKKCNFSHEVPKQTKSSLPDVPMQDVAKNSLANSKKGSQREG